MTSIDLTPFGFTPTESLAYGALTERGPLSGYALAQVLSVARANTYQALHGLSTKGAATPTGDHPERFRPVQPAALFALLAEREARKLDRLEAQLARPSQPSPPTVLPITGQRALTDLCLRTAARAPGVVTCLAPASLLVGLAPAWHKRVADGVGTSLWCLGDVPSVALPVELTGQVAWSMVERFFGAPLAALHAGQTTIVASLREGNVAGYWANDPLFVGVVRASLHAVTGA